MISFKVRTLVICSFVLSTCVLACDRQPRRESGPDRDAPTFTVALGLSDEVPFGPGLPPQFLVFSRLIRQVDADEMEGWLARAWEHSEDYRSWTIHLRSDVQWHDGEPLTARDVEFTLRLTQHPAVVMADPGAYQIEAVDDSTLTVTYSTPIETPTPEGSWTVVWPRHRLEELDPEDFWQWEFWSRPVGTGPFRFVREIEDVAIELEANPDYFRDQPRIERVFLRRGEATVPALLAGELDAIPYLDWTVAQDLAREAGFRVTYASTPHESVALVWNHKSPGLDDARVRRALSLAIDRENLHRLLSLPGNVPPLDLPVCAELALTGQVPAAAPFDPEEAARLLDLAGWTDSDGDGVRDKGDRPFRLKIRVAGEQPDQERAAVFVQQEMRAVGVELEIQVLDGAVVWDLAENGDYSEVDGALQLLLPWEPTGLGHRALFTEGSPIGYENPEIESALDRMKDHPNTRERAFICAELVPVYRRDQPATVLYPMVWNWVVNPRIRGLPASEAAAVVETSSWTLPNYDPLQSIELIWIEEASGE
jgi:peptide/nickel transport system substrate-binding protein